jgi:hypothetical protein
VERVLPNEDIKKRIRDLAVGLSADCDSPESDVEDIMRAKLAGAQRLPFVAFITHKGEWVGGYSGYKDTRAFLRVPATAEKTPYLQASKAVRKKLAGLVAKAEKAAAKGHWNAVIRAGQAAAKTTGRCPERKALAEIVKKARAWAAEQLDAAVRTARAGGDLTEARKALSDLKKKFSGEPEAADAGLGLKALGRLVQIARLEAGGSLLVEAREKETRKYEDTRWAAIFQPAEKPEKEGD